MSDKTKAYEGLTAGTYAASVVDWGVREAQIGTSKQLLAFILFDFEANGKVHRITFEGFFFKKDGGINQKTMETLSVCGFKSTDISTLLSETALNTFKKVSITVELKNGYWRVKWVNDPDATPRGRAGAVTSLAGHDLSRINAALAEKTVGDGKGSNERDLGF